MFTSFHGFQTPISHTCGTSDRRSVITAGGAAVVAAKLDLPGLRSNDRLQTMLGSARSDNTSLKSISHQPMMLWQATPDVSTHSALAELWNSVPWSAMADALSIIGFFLTVKVLWDVRHLQNFYLFKARVPELTDRIGVVASRISELLNDYDGSTAEIQVVLAELEVVLNSLQKKTSSRAKAAAKESIKQIRNYAKQPDETKLRGIYVELRKLGIEVSEIRQDAEWER
jgi:hypothetical protein